MEMTIQRYLLNLISASQNMSEVLAYGHGGYEWLKDMKDLLAQSEEMIPKMEAEICIKEMEELDAEERYHNHMMNMLYGTKELESAFEERTNNKANHLNRRKQNKKNKSRDRIHGRRHGGAHGGVDFRYIDCNPFCNKHRYEDAMFVTNGKHCFNSTKKTSVMDAKEQEYYSSYPTEEEAKEAEAPAETTEEEAGKFDDFLWRLIDELPEQKYVVLFNFDNGRSWEDHEYVSNEFRGVMSKDEIIAKLTKAFLWNDGEVCKVSETEVRGLKGIKFTWDFGHDKWGWNGYESFTIIPVSRLI